MKNKNLFSVSYEINYLSFDNLNFTLSKKIKIYQCITSNIYEIVYQHVDISVKEEILFIFENQHARGQGRIL